MPHSRVTSERLILQRHLEENEPFVTDVPILSKTKEKYDNSIKQDVLGAYRPIDKRKAVTADMEVIEKFYAQKKKLPGFLEAGPRKKLVFSSDMDKERLIVGIVTTGGLAPGLNSVIHSIVERHTKTYPQLLTTPKEDIWGFLDSFRGMIDKEAHRISLTDDMTEKWQDEGGSGLGAVRYRGEKGIVEKCQFGQAGLDWENVSNKLTDNEWASLRSEKLHLEVDLEAKKSEMSEKFGNDFSKILPILQQSQLTHMAKTIADNLSRWGVNILYVIGGDGSLTTAHEIAKHTQETIVVGIPKTMDNDIPWVWQSFGFNTTVEQASAFINTMHYEAEGTRRVAVLEFFGAQSGFVAANATLASGHVDLVMIPEIFEPLDKAAAKRALSIYRHYISNTIHDKSNRDRPNPHAVIVIAEGVGRILAERGAITNNEATTFASDFSNSLHLQNAAGYKVSSFLIQPRHCIRAIPANPHDQIYCKRLGALAVDNALAGYTDFMISQWLTEYVLVPLELVAGRQKRVPIGGIFWKQVVASTGQPLIPGSDCVMTNEKKEEQKIYG